MEELKLRIKQLRTMLGITMAEFAALIEVSPGNVGDWESLKRRSVPSAAALREIAEKCDVSLDWLLFGYERTKAMYSETALGCYSANSIVFETLTSIAIKLPEEKLTYLLDYAIELETSLAQNKKASQK